MKTYILTLQLYYFTTLLTNALFSTFYSTTCLAADDEEESVGEVAEIDERRAWRKHTTLLLYYCTVAEIDRSLKLMSVVPGANMLYSLRLY